MATKRNNAVGQTAPAPASAPATGSITLPEMPPAETFVGLVAYGVDTVANESKQIPLEFLGRGVQACIDATQASTEQMELAKTATANADTATTGANEAAEAARSEASNLSALKEAVSDATADAIEKTKAAETATGAANTATRKATAATADAIEKAEAATTAAEEANAAKDAAIEATENLTADVSALVLTDANKPQIQRLAGIDYSILTEQEVHGCFFVNPNGAKQKVYGRRVSMNIYEKTGLVSLGFNVNTIVNALGYMVEGTNMSTVHMVNQYVVQRRHDGSPGDYAVYVNIPRLAQYGWKIDAFIFYTK